MCLGSWLTLKQHYDLKKTHECTHIHTYTQTHTHIHHFMCLREIIIDPKWFPPVKKPLFKVVEWGRNNRLQLHTHHRLHILSLPSISDYGMWNKGTVHYQKTAEKKKKKKKFCKGINTDGMKQIRVSMRFITSIHTRKVLIQRAPALTRVSETVQKERLWLPLPSTQWPQSAATQSACQFDRSICFGFLFRSSRAKQRAYTGIAAHQKTPWKRLLS